MTLLSTAQHIARDTRKEGRTAGWMIARTARRPGRVGIIVGSYRYLSQEAAEISFRSYFREHAPTFSVLEPLVNLEEARIANEATLHMIEANPDLAGLYICGGGQEGVIEALRAEAGARDLVVVCNELTPVTRAGLAFSPPSSRRRSGSSPSAPWRPWCAPSCPIAASRRDRSSFPRNSISRRISEQTNALR
ncbi:MAG: hypothetical protein J0H63_07275 [Rhizobiales bacterium]|nr:hypothetical protein [Hyphomicrobiales bacterium]